MIAPCSDPRYNFLLEKVQTLRDMIDIVDPSCETQLPAIILSKSVNVIFLVQHDSVTASASDLEYFLFRSQIKQQCSRLFDEG